MAGLADQGKVPGYLVDLVPGSGSDSNHRLGSWGYLSMPGVSDQVAHQTCLLGPGMNLLQ